MRRVSRILTLLVAALCAPGSQVPAQTQQFAGMVLQTSANGAYETAPMTLRYLSKKDSLVTLASDGVYGACFSPDGRNVAYFYHDQPQNPQLIVCGVDGRNRKVLCRSAGDKEPYPTWCTDGSIYWSHCTTLIRRIKADGSQAQADIVFTSKNNIHNMEVSRDGSRAAWTRPPDDKYGHPWWSTTTLELAARSERDFFGGCQTIVSPNGSVIGASDGTHTVEFLLPWSSTLPDEATYEQGCYDLPGEAGQLGMCAIYSKAIVGGTSANEHHFMVRWPRSADSVLLFSAETSPVKGYLYRFGTARIEHATGYFVGNGQAWDYFPTEVRSSVAVPAMSLSPAEVLFSFVAGVTPAAKNVAVVNNTPGTTLGAVTVTGAPGWLNVLVSGSGNAQIVQCSPNMQALPAAGTTSRATLRISEKTYGLKDSLPVILTISPRPVDPIVVLSPRAGDAYTYGQPISVTYAADSTKIGCVTVELSTDNGVSFVLVTTGKCIPSGAHTFVWTPTAQTVPAVSMACVMRVKEYNGGNAATSGVFSIGSGAAVQPRAAAIRQNLLCAGGAAEELYDARGRSLENPGSGRAAGVMVVRTRGISRVSVRIASFRPQ